MTGAWSRLRPEHVSRRAPLLGGARLLCVLLAIGIGGAARPAPDDDDPRGPGPLPWRVGGKLGFTVDAAAFPDSAGDQLEIYLRVPPSTLRALEHEGTADARLKVSVRLRNAYGAQHHEAAQEFDLAPGDTAGFGKVVLLSFPAKSGRYKMLVRLEDLQSRKRGLAYIGRRIAESASVEGWLTVPAAQGGGRLSDIGFVWGEAAPRARAFRGAGAGGGLLPNPERLYGLLATDLRGQFFARGSAEGDWRWKAKLLDVNGQVIAEQESTAAAAPALGQEFVFDVSTIPAGRYECQIQVWQGAETKPMERRSRFTVAWQIGAWMRNPRDIEDDVHFILEAEEEEAFARMGPGEQERYLEDFWRRLDPTSETAENEVRVEFFKRVAHANRTWTRSVIGKGMFTDMGRIYIQHGEPDEILRQVIPAGDQTLTHLLQELQVNEDRPTGNAATRGLGGDVRPFEVWVYEGTRARPITARRDRNANERTAKRLMFLFVDETGYGDFRMRYTNE